MYQVYHVYFVRANNQGGVPGSPTLSLQGVPNPDQPNSMKRPFASEDDAFTWMMANYRNEDFVVLKGYSSTEPK
jgi:hypothetical protein